MAALSSAACRSTRLRLLSQHTHVSSRWQPEIRARTSLLALLRILAMLLAVQLSGTCHVLDDVISMWSSGVLDHEQCPPDRPCDDCPPGCPTCHCPNTLRSTAAQPGPSMTVELPSSGLVELSWDEAAPRGPDLPPPYRPPRTELVC